MDSSRFTLVYSTWPRSSSMLMKLKEKLPFPTFYAHAMVFVDVLARLSSRQPYQSIISCSTVSKHVILYEQGTMLGDAMAIFRISPINFKAESKSQRNQLLGREFNGIYSRLAGSYRIGRREIAANQATWWSDFKHCWEQPCSKNNLRASNPAWNMYVTQVRHSYILEKGKNAGDQKKIKAFCK